MPFPFKSPFHVFTLWNLTNKTVNFISQVPVLQKLDSATIQWIRIGTNQLRYLLQSWPKGFGTPPPFHVFLLGIAANGLKKIFPHPNPPLNKVKVLKLYKICKSCLTCNTQHCSGGGRGRGGRKFNFNYIFLTWNTTCPKRFDEDCG